MNQPGGATGSRILATLVLAVVVFAGLGASSDIAQLRDAIGGFDAEALALALLLVMASYGLRFWRWELYLRQLSIELPRGESVQIFLAGFLMSITPAKMGEVLKSWLLYQAREIPIERTVPIVVAERVLDLVGLLAVVAVASSSFEHGRLLTAAGALIVLAITAGCTLRPVADLLPAVCARVPLARRLVPRLRGAQRSLHELMRPPLFARAAVLAFVGWGLEAVATYAIARGFSGARVSLLAAAFSYGAGTFAGAISMLPGGLGVAELGMKGLLELTADEITPAVSAAVTVLVRLTTLWFGVAIGALSLAWFRWVRARPTE